MRILFLSDARTYHTQRWVNYFVHQGHECFLATLEEGLETEAEEFLIPGGLLPNFLRYPLSAGRIRSIAERIKPDLVNAHFVPSYGLVGAMLKFRPLVVSTWGSDVLISPGKSWLHGKRTRYVLGKADLVIADAEVTAEAISRLGVERGRVLVSPMGIERTLIRMPSREEKPHVVVLSNRKLEPVYDVATLVKAIPTVMERSPREVRFVILGEGSQKGRLLNLAIKLKVENHLEFKGVVTRVELLRLYQESDVYVSTSLSDSTSVSLLEAMNFGLIPIVTDIPGNREWVEEGNNGFLFSTSSPRALADKIISAVNQPDRWPAFRKANHGIIRRRAVWEDNMKAVEDRFGQLVTKEPFRTRI